MKFKVCYYSDASLHHKFGWFTGLRRIREELQPPPSQLWFCTVCGKIYARIEVSNSANGNVIPYTSFASRCEEHPRDTYYSIYTGGSILAENLNDIKEMPAELVEKEFWIHLKETERLIKLERLGDE